jgi:hypothetical protein
MSHGAFEQLAATTNGLIAARGGIAHCHAALAETRKSIPGLRTVDSAMRATARRPSPKPTSVSWPDHGNG